MRGYKTREQLQEEAARKQKEHQEAARRQREEAERHASSKRNYMIVFILVMLTVVLEIGVFIANHSTESRGDELEPNDYELRLDSDSILAPEDSDSNSVPWDTAAPCLETETEAAEEEADSCYWEDSEAPAAEAE